MRFTFCASNYQAQPAITTAAVTTIVTTVKAAARFDAHGTIEQGPCPCPLGISRGPGALQTCVACSACSLPVRAPALRHRSPCNVASPCVLQRQTPRGRAGAPGSPWHVRVCSWSSSGDRLGGALTTRAGGLPPLLQDDVGSQAARTPCPPTPTPPLRPCTRPLLQADPTDQHVMRGHDDEVTSLAVSVRGAASRLAPPPLQPRTPAALPPRT